MGRNSLALLGGRNIWKLLEQNIKPARLALYGTGLKRTNRISCLFYKTGLRLTNRISCFFYKTGLKEPIGSLLFFRTDFNEPIGSLVFVLKISGN